MKNTLHWDNTLLEPVLITFNRAACVKQTLQAFVAAGLTDMRFHVLDNASADDTQQVVSQIQSEYWPNLVYHRNQYNIGGNANILRAVEITDSYYCWIIGDDDLWHLENVQELIIILREKKADIVRLGWLVSDEVRNKMLSASQLLSREKLFFASLGMISATVIKRSLITSCLPFCYMNITDAYPQLVPVLQALNQAVSLNVYSLKHDLMTHTPSKEPGYFFGDLEWYSGWFRTSRFLQDKKLRVKFVDEISAYMVRPNWGFWQQLFWLEKVMLNYKALKIPQGKYLLTMIAYGSGWRGRMICISLTYLLIPTRLASFLRKWYLRLRKLPEKSLRYDRSRI